MVEGRSVELRISLRASEQALKLLSLSIFSSDQETFSYEHVQTSSMLMDNSIPTVSCLGAVIITQQITAYPAGMVFSVTSGAQELINSVSRHYVYCRLTSVGYLGGFLVQLSCVMIICV